MKRTAMNAAGPAPGTDAKAGKIEILFGTEQGSVGQLFLDGNAVTRGWVIDAARGVGGVSALYGDMDCTGDGNCDVVVGRDDGGLEVYALDTNGQPALVYQKSLGEAVQTIRHGCVSSPFPEILVHTFSGKVLGFAPGSDSRTIDGFGLGAEKTEHEERQDNMRAEKRVKQLNKELEKLAKEVEKAKENYAAVSGGLIAVDGPAKVLDRFVLDADDACYALSLEAPAALFSVSVHSDVPIDLLDVKDNAAICSRSPADPANGTHAAATYRVNEGNNRVELRMRAIEGRAGTVRSFVVPRQSPKTSTEKVHHIKPLCLHRRVNAMSSAAAGAGARGEDEASTAAEEDAGAAAAAPVNELVVRGDFTLDDAHHWCVVCLNEIPTRTPTGVEHATYEFENVLLKTTLKIVIGDGEMTCVSDNVSPLALLKDLIGKEATENQLRVNFSFNLSDASVAHFCDRAHPLIEYQRELVRKGELVEGLKELRTQENGDVDFLDDEYKRILADEAKIVAELKEQPRRLEYLHGVVKDFTVDWHKFRGSNVKRALAGIDEALALGDVSRERLEEIVSRGAA